jgi:hypothetical protein
MTSKSEKQRRKELQRAVEQRLSEQGLLPPLSPMEQVWKTQRETRARREKSRQIDADAIAQLSDQELILSIFDHIDLAIGDHLELDGTLVAIQALPVGYRIFVHIQALVGEVDNGGYNQYFWNSSGKYAVDALESLRTIGATEHETLHHKAMLLHEEDVNDPHFRSLVEQHTLKAFSETYEHTRLDECDTEFYEQSSFLEQKLAAYIRRKPELFAHTVPPKPKRRCR